jgi:DNA-binding response OmpR family regulator
MPLILVIDDDDQIRDMLREMLERAGYEVVLAADGDEGLRLFRERRADLVITDVVMPNKEGIEMIMELRVEFPKVKIIAISGGGRLGPETYLDLAEGFGAMRVFSKPFRLNELLAAVRELLGEDGMQD